MPVVRITDPTDPVLADYTRLTDVALRAKHEPAKGLYIAEAYDSKNKLLKEFSVRAVKNGRIKALEIRNAQTDSKTILEFDLEVPIKKESDSP